MADISLIVDYKQVQEAVKQIEAMSPAARKSAAVLKRAFTQVESQQRKALSSVKQQMAASKRLEAQKLKEANAAVKAAQELIKEEERLKNKFVEGYTAMNIYTKELNDLAVARKKDIITSEQQAAAVEALNADMAAGTGAFKSYGSSIQQTRSRQSQLGVLFQQTGYQVGDFAVQVQSGQNAMVAFGQQATQLVGTFGMLSQSTKMIAAFAGLGIAIPVLTAIGAAFMRARSGAEEAGEKAKGFEEALKSARSEVQGMENDLRLLQSGFENAFQLSLSDNVKKAADALVEAERALAAEIEVLSSRGAGPETEGYAELQEYLERSTVAARDLVAEREKELDAALKTAKELSNLNDLHEQATMFVESQAEAQEDARAKAEETLSTIAALEDEYSEAVVTALALAGVDITSPISSAADEAARLATNLGIALSAAANMLLADRQMQNTARYKYSSRGTTSSKAPFQIDDDGVETSVSSLLAGFERDKKAAARAGSRKSGGGGGGKSSAEELSEYLANLQQQAELERQLVGLFGEKRSTEEEVIKARQKYGEVFGASQEAELRGTLAQIEADKERQAALEESNAQMQSIADTMQSSMSDASMSMVDGTKSFKDAMEDMARAVIKQLFDILVVQQLVGSFDAQTKQGTGLAGALMGGLSGLLGGGKGVGSVRPPVKSFSGGGYTGDGSRSGGLDGEGGYLAMLHPKETVVDHTKGQSLKGGGDVYNISQSFNFSANGDESVKKIIAQAAPQIAKMTQQGLMDQRRRGGVVKSTFS